MYRHHVSPALDCLRLPVASMMKSNEAVADEWLCTLLILATLHRCLMRPVTRMAPTTLLQNTEGLPSVKGAPNRTSRRTDSGSDRHCCQQVARPFVYARMDMWAMSPFDAQLALCTLCQAARPALAGVQMGGASFHPNCCHKLCSRSTRAAPWPMETASACHARLATAASPLCGATGVCSSRTRSAHAWRRRR